MTWSDEPTNAQLQALFGMMKWCVEDKLLMSALDYLKLCKTRREVNYELSRIHKLYVARKLDENNVFDAEIWEDFALIQEEDDE